VPSLSEKNILTPRQYLDIAASWGNSAPHPAAGWIVRGTVDLSASPLKNKIRLLPPARIEGDLRASGSRSLETVCCEVRDDVWLDGSGVKTLGPGFAAHASFSANRCRQLEVVEGFFPATVELEESGIRVLSKNFKCRGDLYLAECDQLEFLDCAVGGSVFANRSAVASLGENFSCAGELHLTACENIKRIGKVNGPPTTVYLPDSGVEKITEDFVCSGSLVIKDNYSLKEVSGSVGQSTNISNSPILEKIFSLHAAKSLSVANCPSLRTAHFTTKGPASFHRCGMPSLSAAASAQGELSVIDCGNFRRLGGSWGGDVTLVDLCALQSIEKDFICDQDLTVRKCPDLIRLCGRVRGQAHLVDLGALEDIKEDLIVVGDLKVDAAGTHLKSIGCLVGGNATVVNAPMLESTSQRFKVGLSARFQSCPEFRVLRGCVYGDAELKQGTRIEKIGADFECRGNLIISNCPPVKNMNCAITGNLILEHTSVEKIGPAFRCLGKIIADHPWPHSAPEELGPAQFSQVSSQGLNRPRFSWEKGVDDSRTHRM